MIIITDRLIDDNLELIISPLYKDSVGTLEETEQCLIKKHININGILTTRKK